MEADATTDWVPRRPSATWRRKPNVWRTYHSTSPKLIRRGEPAQPLQLSVLLKDLLGEEFGARAVLLPPTREELVLRQDPLVRSLTLALKLDADAERKTERFLDGLFQDLRRGELFKHSEVVMGVLVAVHASGVDWFHQVGDAFATSTIAEVARIARLAKRLAR